jgi:beta-glucanase (GH16 family)
MKFKLKIRFFFFLSFSSLISVNGFSQICTANKVVLAENVNCVDDSFTLFFEDNFDSDSLDKSKWIPVEGVVRDVSRILYQQWYSPKNIQSKDGVLKLVAKEEKIVNQNFDIWIDNGMKNFTQDFDYTAGEINSVNEFSYGKYEIKCKIPKGKGFFPAFWTFGGNGYNEIDVFEFWNEKNSFGKYDAKLLSKIHKMNMHYDYNYDGKSSSCASKYKGPDFSENFHIFTMIWTPYKIEWYVDNELKRKTTLFYSLLGQNLDCESLKAFQPYLLNTSFPHKSMFIIANLGIQSDDNSPDNDTNFPQSFEIDYIKYYKLN